MWCGKVVAVRVLTYNFPSIYCDNHVESNVGVQGWKASTPANKRLAVANSTGKLFAFFTAPEVEFILELDPEELLAT